MRVPSLLLAASLVTTTGALAPAADSRRAFLSQAGSAVASAVAVGASAAPVLAADKYDLNFDESIVPAKKESPKKSDGGGGLIVGGALGGGLLLSLPFFAPNLARLAGVKNAKLPKK